MMETGRGVVHPWLCDGMGHFTTRHYTAAFDDASYHMAHACGLKSSQEIGFTDVQLTMKFFAEMRSGSLFYVRSGFLKLGNSSFTMFHQMYNCDDDALVASLEEVAVFFDLVKRKSMKIPDSFRTQAMKFFMHTK